MNVEFHRIARRVGRTLSNVKHAAIKIVDGIDNTLYNIGDTNMDKFLDKSQKNAMTNARYAEIEAMRKREDGTMILFDDRLTISDWEEQQKIRDSITPPSKLLPLYRFLRNHPLQSGIKNVQHAYQRLTRGWDDTATWGLDTHLCETLGAQLKHLAETAHGWPQSEIFPEFEDWQKALHKHGDALLRYANQEDYVFHDEKYDTEIEEKIIVQAQASLYWVAQNLPALWD